jgi:RNA-directed DNA polymerase
MSILLWKRLNDLVKIEITFIHFMNNRDSALLRGGGGDIHSFKKLISLDNLFDAWKIFRHNKGSKPDVQEFEFNLETNLFALHKKLRGGFYNHDRYEAFYVRDPKLRHIHKATITDRIVHHAVISTIEPSFEKGFIFDSYAARKGKGLHKAVGRLRGFLWKTSQNNTATVWALKCDVRKFFDSVDHGVLLDLIRRRVSDPDILALIENIVSSFAKAPGKGLPLGNVTSQLFSNVYLNELDQFVKRTLRVKQYIRYADDFIILSRDRSYLESLLPTITKFLNDHLKLEVHPNKIVFAKWHNGIDFLGYILFPYHTLLRTKTKKRMVKNIHKNLAAKKRGDMSEDQFEQSLRSYLGVMKHANTHRLVIDILNEHVLS